MYRRRLRTLVRAVGVLLVVVLCLWAFSAIVDGAPWALPLVALNAAVLLTLASLLAARRTL